MRRYKQDITVCPVTFHAHKFKVYDKTHVTLRLYDHWNAITLSLLLVSCEEINHSEGLGGFTTPRVGHTIMSCLHLLIQSTSHFRSHGPLRDPQLYFGGFSFDITVCCLKPNKFRQFYSMQHVYDLLTEKIRLLWICCTITHNDDIMIIFIMSPVQNVQNCQIVLSGACSKTS